MIIRFAILFDKNRERKILQFYNKFFHFQIDRQKFAIFLLKSRPKN